MESRNFVTLTASLLSRISSVIIKGTAIGSNAAGDHFGIVAEQISALVIGGIKQFLFVVVDNLSLDSTNNDFRLVDQG